MDDLAETECNAVATPPKPEEPGSILKECDGCGEVSHLTDGLCGSCDDRYKPTDYVEEIK